jgi:hypothetical protein
MMNHWYFLILLGSFGFGEENAQPLLCCTNGQWAIIVVVCTGRFCDVFSTA